MPDDARAWNDEARERRMSERERPSPSRWRQERSYSSGRQYGDRPYGTADYGRRGDHREYGYRGAPDPSRDYSGVSWGLSGGHGQDRDVARTGAGLEAGYASYHRPDATDWRGVEPWRIPGPHTGRGPRGYQRSDERIRDEANDRLTAHGWIDATDIECNVEHGEVMLTGFVDGRPAKRAAQEVVEDVPGVRDVHNHLRIRTNAPDAEGVGRTSVLGLTERQTQSRSNTPPDARRSRTRS